MHMHAHSKDCVIDYGPPHTFWAFAFERYNGILDEQPNNNRFVELQLAKGFVCDNRQLLTSLPETYKDQFFPYLSPVGMLWVRCVIFLLWYQLQVKL